MPRLVAVAAAVAAGGADFLDRLERVWADGDALLPIDPRLGRPAVERLLDALAPALVVQADGTSRARSGGRSVQPGDALVVATSGTTGEAKGVVLTHAAIAASAFATSRQLAVDPRRDRWLACLPLAHIGGLSVITRARLTGTPLTVHEGFDAAAVEAESRRPAGSTLVALVPTALRRLDPSGFRTVLLGGDALPQQRPGNVVATYGMTETGSGVVYDGWPLMGVELEVDAAGEIRVRAPMLGRAYRDAAGERPLAGPDGWFATGDAGRLGADGRLSVDGRMGDVIVTGGEKVWPRPVEEVLGRVAGVAEVAVVGQPDPEWGSRVVAVVVPTDPGCPPTLASLRAAVRDELAAYAAPRVLVLAEALPRTALGKIRRHAALDPPVE